MERECFFVDVFTDAPYAGNQLAVFPKAEGINDQQMQRLAQEINYSETTFILDGDKAEADFEVRIFTIQSELPFAGHPIIGTAYTITDILGIGPEGVLRLKTKVGVIPIEKEGQEIWMTQNQPQFFRQYSDKAEIAALADLSPHDIADDLPVEEVSTGANILIVPVKSLKAVQKAAGNVTNMSRFFKNRDSIAPYLFTLETVDKKARVHSRFFGAHMGIIEDPATGSAAGPLVAYLLKYNVFGKSFEIMNEQGLEMGRPSKILMKGALKDNGYTIKIGGKSAYVGRGRFEI